MIVRTIAGPAEVLVEPRDGLCGLPRGTACEGRARGVGVGSSDRGESATSRMSACSLGAHLLESHHEGENRFVFRRSVEGEAVMGPAQSQPPTFEAVVQEMWAPLHRYLERLTGNRIEADDLLQETLMRIARGLPGFEAGCRVNTWAYSIATRVAVDHYGRCQASTVEMDRNADTEAEAAAVETEEPFAVDEVSAGVRSVINTLSAEYRTALVLRDLEGLTDAEVAAVAGCSLAVTKIRIHRARCRLRAALENERNFYREWDGAVRL